MLLVFHEDRQATDKSFTAQRLFMLLACTPHLAGLCVLSDNEMTALQLTDVSVLERSPVT